MLDFGAGDGLRGGGCEGVGALEGNGVHGGTGCDGVGSLEFLDGGVGR